MKFFFTGHISLDNRGSEAIVRSLIKLIKASIPEATFVIPSNDRNKDAQLWGKDSSVIFMPTNMPFKIRAWSRLTKFNFFQKILITTAPRLPKSYRKAIESADIVLSIGGDMYTDEGSFPLWIYSADKYAIECKKAVYLMGATVSHFKNEVHMNLLASHFKNFRGVLVRESDSFKRLENDFNLTNVMLTSDSAFWLDSKEPQNIKYITGNEKNYKRVVGINISPLLEKLGDTSKVKLAISDLISNNPTDYFILIPHVFVVGNDDLIYLKQFMDDYLVGSDNVTLIQERHSAEELKYLIGRLDIFIGARTHATIAAFSQFVPTISIAYSDKAKGITASMYGHDNYIISFKSLTSEVLAIKFKSLLDDLDMNIQILKNSVLREKNISKNILENLFGKSR